MAFSKKQSRLVVGVLWGMSAVGIVIPVLLFFWLRKGEFGLCCYVSFLFAVVAVILAYLLQQTAPPHFRRVRFFNSTRRKVKGVTIKKVLEPEPSDPPLTPLPVIEVPPVPRPQVPPQPEPPVSECHVEAPYEEPYEKKVTQLQVSFDLVDPKQTPPVVHCDFPIDVPDSSPPESFIEELEVWIAEMDVNSQPVYGGQAFVHYGPDCAAPLVRSDPVLFQAP